MFTIMEGQTGWLSRTVMYMLDPLSLARGIIIVGGKRGYMRLLIIP